MASLYGSEMAKVYDEIYQGFIDYTAEYQFYKHICNTYNSQNILEMGCGTGNLSSSFAKDFEKYVGLDYSDSMLAIAMEKYPSGIYVQADMRYFDLKQKFDAVLITGRSTSYLMDDADLNSTFLSVHNTLENGGLFVFDCIDAELFIPYIEKNRQVLHVSNCYPKTYERNSSWFKKPSETYHLVNWEAQYYEVKNTERILLGTDNSTFRVFTKSEITLLLKNADFEILDVQYRKTYAFDSFVVIAKKGGK